MIHRAVAVMARPRPTARDAGRGSATGVIETSEPPQNAGSAVVGWVTAAETPNSINHAVGTPAFFACPAWGPTGGT